MNRQGFAGLNNRILFGVVLIIVSMGVLIAFGGGYIFGTAQTLLGYLGWADAGTVQVNNYRVDRQATNTPFRVQFKYINDADHSKEVFFKIKGENLLGKIPSDAPSSVIQVAGNGGATETQEFVYGDDDGESIGDIKCEFTIEVLKMCGGAEVPLAGCTGFGGDTLSNPSSDTTKTVQLSPSETPEGANCN